MTTQKPSYLQLTAKQRIYVDSRLAGMSQTASAAAAGSSRPKTEQFRFETHEGIQAAMIECMQATADDVDFSRKEAHDMYMDAHQNAETAMEQIAAINAMVKLHGLEKPKVVEIAHKPGTLESLEYMPLDELMKHADMEDLVLEGEFTIVNAVPKLGAPEVTDDNTEDEPPKLPTVSNDY